MSKNFPTRDASEKRDNEADCDYNDMLIGGRCRAKLWNMCEWGDRLLLYYRLYLTRLEGRPEQ